MADKSITERFWSKVHKADACWLWTASVSGNNSYGMFRFDGRMQPAHRVSWTLEHGPIPAGLCVLHRCDTPQCVNPAHLFLGTHAENMADMMAKGRHVVPIGEAHGKSKLTEADVRAIREDTRLHRVIATEFGVDKSLVGQLKRGRGWNRVAQNHRGLSTVVTVIG